MLNITLANILDGLRTVAKGQADAATARADIRETIPTLFPDAPTLAEIETVKKSDQWVEFDGQARRIFAVAWCTAPRMVKMPGDDKATEYLPSETDIRFWESDNKTAKAYAPDETAIRKAMQAYVRVSVKQNITEFIPDAIDATETEEAVKLPDPVAILALVDAALVTLSEHDNKAALALLNGLDALVTACRKPLAEGKALSRKD
jgi:hypothetical protein